MPNRLSDWIHRKAAQRPSNGNDNFHNGREESPKELFLSNSTNNSNTHRRPLTPKPLSRPSSRWIRCNGPFYKLPPAVRRRIITTAFGDRGLHLILEYCQAHKRNPHSHAGFWPGQSARGPFSDVEWDKSSATTWRWRSCVCHREPPARKWSALHISLDGCLQGEPTSCAHWQTDDTMPLKCLIGVMGWLLSCRQSYTETMDVLYSSNIFKIDDWSQALRYIPRLIPPQRLASLKVVEIQYCMRGKTVADATMPGDSPFDGLLLAMRQVELVHISLYGGDFTPLDRKPRMDKDDLKRRGMIYEAGKRWTHIMSDSRLKHLFLAVPSSIYNGWRAESARQANELIHDYPGPRFWQAVDAPELSPGNGTARPSVKAAGFWIVQGVDDYTPPESHCFQIH
ncbi:hypothetical protein QQS21_007287 [Conoideocrella luteorostrata]|uniref:DUF7730 domain-containing protein n=1 Tax=Conoideocrella luteorostrata TaxID=1105319 RepID=A0AAJ0CKY6_9HYPO|nr:hypothetical protein QQS21_007287 [Conoideocrella luteorostrata]